MREIYMYWEIALKILIAFLILKLILSKVLKKYHSNWSCLIEDFNFSSEDFYELLKIEIEEKGIKHIKFKTVKLSTGTPFGYKRNYLRIDWGDYQYFVCLMPMGKGLFISWWLMYKNSFGKILISKIPIIGTWLSEKLFPKTFYKIDSASAFMSYAQSCVSKVIEDITKDKGVKLNIESQKPILNDIFKR